MNIKLIYIAFIMPSFLAFASEAFTTTTIINPEPTSQYDFFASNSKKNISSDNNLENDAIKNINLNSDNYEKEFIRAKTLLESPKTKNLGITLLNKFLYVSNSDYKFGAILELGQSKSPLAIKFLYKKGLHLIARRDAELLEDLTNALISLNAKTTILNLVKFSNEKKTFSLTVIIRDEYLAFTNGTSFEKMEQMAGKVYD